jgi:hypothetical protein
LGWVAGPRGGGGGEGAAVPGGSRGTCPREGGAVHGRAPAEPAQGTGKGERGGGRPRLGRTPDCAARRRGGERGLGVFYFPFLL